MCGQQQNCHGQWTFLNNEDYYIKDLYIKNHTKSNQRHDTILLKTITFEKLLYIELG
jgi:hypothetical protein